MIKKAGISFLFLLQFSFAINAQLTQVLIEPDASFKQAKLLYQQNQFSLAFPLFTLFYNNGIKNSRIPTIVQKEATYYYIICGLQLDDESVVQLAKSYIEIESDSTNKQLLGFYVGEYYYRKKEFGIALDYYEQSKNINLNSQQIATKIFHQGYCYFLAKQFDKAKPLFNTIRQVPNDPNYIDANYYYGFILFNDQQYNEAITSFLVAEKDHAYKNVVPFYLTELYYFNGDIDRALKYGETIDQDGDLYYNLQLQQLLGHLWFEKRQFEKALPYLEKYNASTPKVRRVDLYELAYCYYEAKQYPKAIEGFKQIGGAEDSLGQNSMYLLADAYLKVNDLQNARNAFQFCAANNSNPTQKEVSAFYFAKLTYDLNYFGDAATSLKKFIAAYPLSSYIDESKELLISALSNTSNYKDGLAIYNSLTNKSAAAAKIYPTLLYGRAVELINDQNTIEAEKLLDSLLVVQYNIDKLPLVNFWKGELSYRAGRVDLAIGYLQNYLKNPKRNGEVNSTNARYNLAYCYLKMENYRLAKEQFELVNKSSFPSNTDIDKDAFLRIGDCYFMLKEYKLALSNYDQVIQNGWASADYATYQKGIIAGALNKPKEKLQFLESIEKNYPVSTMIPQAQLEIANTYLAQEEYNNALNPLYKLINNDKAVSLHPQAYLKLGIALFNLNKNDPSLDQFKVLLTKYANSPETASAIEYIRNIFIEKQQPGEFVALMELNGRPISSNEADSLTFRSAYNRYEAKDNIGAQTGLTEYVLKFPNGKYAIEANYFLAELNIVQKQFTTALPFYNKVASLSPNKYAERSALQSARIYYFDLKNYEEASKYYALLKQIAQQQENRLEAMRGLLRCQFKLKLFAEASENANELLLQKGIAADDQLMAGFVIAKTNQLNGKNDQAMVGYKKLLSFGKSEITAEAQYRIAELLFLNSLLSESEKAAFDLIKYYGSYDYWVTSSYILIGDIYFKQNDLFNAEATFRSVSDNSTVIELKKLAGEKLLQVIAQKEKTTKVQL
jgi:TolA-binding protein